MAADSDKPKGVLQYKECALPSLLKDSKGNPIRLKSKELKKQAILTVKPGYPAGCRCAGKVTVEVVIDSTGKVFCALATVGHPLARVSIVDFVRQWRFKPFINNGSAVAVVGALDFQFTSHGEVTY